MTAFIDSADTPEPVEDFRLRVRAWLAATMSPMREGVPAEDSWDHQRVLQRLLWDGGFAGIRFPSEYGGLGLTAAHQVAFNEEATGFEMPTRLNVPSLGILAATLIDCATHEQKARHIPEILSGSEIWVQFLSEPSGGSDLAGCLTKAERDGDVWILNGSKIWSSGAVEADYALCLARTNWDVPKHRGLTMFIVKIHQPGIRVDQIRQVNGSLEFCQEFFDDVVLSGDAVVGAVDDGWSVALRLLTHERLAVGGGSPYANGSWVSPMTPHGGKPEVRASELSDAAARENVRQVIAHERILTVVGDALTDRVTKGMRTGALPSPSGALLKLFSGTRAVAKAEFSLSVGGTSAVVWISDDPSYRSPGEQFLWRQSGAIAGGTNEMQRNVISERVLGMPREWAADRDVPFRDVRRNAPTSRR